LEPAPAASPGGGSDANSSSAHVGNASALLQCKLSPGSACVLVQQLVSQACAATSAQLQPSSPPSAQRPAAGPDAAAFLQACLQQLLPDCVGLLSASDEAMRRLNSRLLLPSMLQAAAARGVDWQAWVHAAVHHRCVELLQQPGKGRQAALAVLLQHSSSLVPQSQLAPPQTLSSAPAGSSGSGGGSTSSRHPFWSALRSCLAEADAAVCKRALALLKVKKPQCWPAAICLSRRPPQRPAGGLLLGDPGG
jgi:hypothetical protein